MMRARVEVARSINVATATFEIASSFGKENKFSFHSPLAIIKSAMVHKYQ
jgi:hypothetical protein